MLRVKYFVVAISLLAALNAVKSEEIAKKKFLPCNAANETSPGCPESSRCIENGTINGTLQSSCVCQSNYTSNPDYVSTDNKSQYCILKEPHPADPPAPTAAPPTQATAAPSIVTTTTAKAETKPTAKTEPPPTPPKPEATTKEPESHKDDVKVTPAPHHILGGIFLPIFIVLAFIGGVFAIRRYSLIERAHGYIRNRGQQTTRYNGLMENDFDDDPLLI